VKVVFHAGAAADLTTAGDWYEAKRSGLGREFRDEVARAIELIAEDPTRWPRFPETKDERVRRLLLRRFPFALAYVIESDLVRLVSIAHTKRRRDYWRRRLRTPK